MKARVDLGYNIAQSIGYIALFGLLQHDDAVLERAAGLLRAHAIFVYPNGTVDNSWGTRSFKWDYESGTKTAPGVYFTFALLADRDPAFARLGRQCLAYLNAYGMEHGWVIYGPEADNHPGSDPPCNYPTFARAQSIALAIEYGRDAAAPAESRGSGGALARLFPPINVAVIRTAHLMATISANGEIGRYGRAQVSRGGSITNLWLDDFAGAGMFETSSTTIYHREEPAHMPVEKDLLSLTPRIECVRDGVYYTNLYEAEAKLAVMEESGDIKVTASGELRDVAGRSSGVAYTLTHRFYPDRIQKEFSVRSPQTQAIRIVEPIVKAAGVAFERSADGRVLIEHAGGPTWSCALTRHSTACTLSIGTDGQRYWSPFPAVECEPIITEFVTGSQQPETSVVLTPGPAEEGSPWGRDGGRAQAHQAAHDRHHLRRRDRFREVRLVAGMEGPHAVFRTGQRRQRRGGNSRAARELAQAANGELVAVVPAACRCRSARCRGQSRRRPRGPLVHARRRSDHGPARAQDPAEHRHGVPVVVHDQHPDAGENSPPLPRFTPPGEYIARAAPGSPARPRAGRRRRSTPGPTPGPGRRAPSPPCASTSRLTRASPMPRPPKRRVVRGVGLAKALKHVGQEIRARCRSRCRRWKFPPTSSPDGIGP